MNEIKSIKLELKDIDLGKREALIAHCVYDVPDKVGDVSRKGMFQRAWANSKQNIGFYFNHNPDIVPGKVLDVFEDGQKAYTRVKMGTHTWGNDMLSMLDEQIVKAASFGYYVVQAGTIEMKGRKYRELKHVRQTETSVLSLEPANDLAGVISVTKAADLYDRMNLLQNYVRNSSASDECLKSIAGQIETINRILIQAEYPDTTEGAHDAGAIVSSQPGKIIEFANRLKLINSNF